MMDKQNFLQQLLFSSGCEVAVSLDVSNQCASTLERSYP